MAAHSVQHAAARCTHRGRGMNIVVEAATFAVADGLGIEQPETGKLDRTRLVELAKLH